MRGDAEIADPTSGTVDLLEIWHRIANDSVTVANRVGDDLEAPIRRLVEMPGMGHRRADVSDARYRFWTVYSYVIAYRYDEDTLTIVRVIHGARNFRRLFGGGR